MSKKKIKDKNKLRSVTFVTDGYLSTSEIIDKLEYSLGTLYSLNVSEVYYDYQGICDG